MPKKRWRIRSHDSAKVTALEKNAGIPSILAQLLVARGVEVPENAQRFLAAKMTGLRDPDLLPGLAPAADLIHQSIVDGKRITIFGDYDADGMTSTAILVRCLRLLSAKVDFYVPNRLREGYGLNDQSLEQLAARGTQMVITVDCGIASLKEAHTARQLGMQLIITDHHELAESLPQAAGIVHPRLPGFDYPFDGLCGAGVAFKLAWALCQRRAGSAKVAPAMRDYLMSAIGLAAIGTVADVVPLADENRLLVRHGLGSIKNMPCAGLAALLKITKLDQKRELASEDIAFTIGPRLNAAGRLGQAELGVELLTTDCPDRAGVLADHITELNGTRDTLERSIYLAAHKQAHHEYDVHQDAALVLAGRDWHVGVIGIVAGRLAERLHRPVVILSMDKMGSAPAIGSARSVPGLNLYEGFKHCQTHLAGFGGHAAAAGLQISEGNIQAFRAAFCQYVGSQISVEQRIAELNIDAEAPLVQLTLRTVAQMEQLAPFGQDNPRPLLCTSDVTLAEPPRCIGAGNRHLVLKLRQHNLTLKALAFGRAEWADHLAAVEGPIEIAYRPVINEFRGRRNVEIHLVDWRPA